MIPRTRCSSTSETSPCGLQALDVVVDGLRRVAEHLADLRAGARLGELAQDLDALGLQQRVGLLDRRRCRACRAPTTSFVRQSDGCSSERCTVLQRRTTGSNGLQKVPPKVQTICQLRRATVDRPRRHVRRPAAPGADDDLLQPGLDRGAVPGRPARRPDVRARAARGLGRRDGGRPRDRPRRARAGAPALARPGSATPSPRSPPRA